MSTYDPRVEADFLVRTLGTMTDPFVHQKDGYAVDARDLIASALRGAHAAGWRSLNASRIRDDDGVISFKHDCVGVRLCQRDVDDPHVEVEMLVEDDGNWFLSARGLSSHWLPESQGVLAAARAWIEANCDPDMHDGRQYGWRFRGRV